METTKLHTAAVLIDLTGEILIEAGLSSLLGYDLRVLVGKNLADLFIFPHRLEFPHLLRHMMTIGVKSKQYLTEILRSDANIMDVDLFLSATEDGFSIWIAQSSEETCFITYNSLGVILHSSNAESVFYYTDREMPQIRLHNLVPMINSTKCVVPNVEEMEEKSINLVVYRKDGALVPIIAQVTPTSSVRSCQDASIFQATIQSLDISKEVVFVLDSDSTILQANDKYLHQMFGHHSTDVIGMPIHTLIPHLECTIDSDATHASKRRKSSDNCWISSEFSRKIHMRHADGSLIPIILTNFQVEIPMGPVQITRVRREPQQSSHGNRFQVGNYLIDRDQVVQDVQLEIQSNSHLRKTFNLETGKTLTVKIVDKSNMSDQDVNHVTRNVKILSQLEHPNILQVEDVINDMTNMYIFLEPVSGLTLHNYLCENRSGKSEVKKIIRQMADAIAYCHSRGMLHCDIRPSSIIVSDGIIKLTDFGSSRMRDDDHGHRMVMRHVESDDHCMTPEMLLGMEEGPEADVWKLGSLLFTILAGKSPFKSAGEILEGKLEFPVHMEENLVQLTQSMLHQDPDERITLQGILSHPWLNDIMRPPIPALDAVSLVN